MNGFAPRRSAWAIGGLALLAVVALVAAFANWRSQGGGALAGQPGDPDATTVAEQLTPGDTYMRTVQKWERWGPAADEVPEAFHPQTTVSEGATTFGEDGCLAQIATTVRDLEGNVVDETLLMPGDASVPEHVASACIADFQQWHADWYGLVLAQPGAEAREASDGIIEVVSPSEYQPVPPSPGRGYRVPYTDDLDITEVTESFFVRADTLDMAGMELTAHLTDGSEVVLVRWEVLEVAIVPG